MIEFIILLIVCYILTIFSVVVGRWWMGYVSEQVGCLPEPRVFELQVRDLFISIGGPLTILIVVCMSFVGLVVLLIESDFGKRRIL